MDSDSNGKGKRDNLQCLAPILMLGSYLTYSIIISTVRLSSQLLSSHLNCSYGTSLICRSATQPWTFKIVIHILICDTYLFVLFVLYSLLARLLFYVTRLLGPIGPRPSHVGSGLRRSWAFASLVVVVYRRAYWS